MAAPLIKAHIAEGNLTEARRTYLAYQADSQLRIAAIFQPDPEDEHPCPSRLVMRPSAHVPMLSLLRHRSVTRAGEFTGC